MTGQDLTDGINSDDFVTAESTDAEIADQHHHLQRGPIK